MLATAASTSGGGSVPLYTIYILLGVVATGLTLATMGAKWVRAFARKQRQHEQTFIEVSQAVAGVPPTRFTQGQKGLVQNVQDLTEQVTQLTREVQAVKGRLEKLEGRGA